MGRSALEALLVPRRHVGLVLEGPSWRPVQPEARAQARAGRRSTLLCLDGMPGYDRAWSGLRAEAADRCAEAGAGPRKSNRACSLGAAAFGRKQHGALGRLG